MERQADTVPAELSGRPADAQRTASGRSADAQRTLGSCPVVRVRLQITDWSLERAVLLSLDGLVKLDQSHLQISD